MINKFHNTSDWFDSRMGAIIIIIIIIIIIVSVAASSDSVAGRCIR